MALKLMEFLQNEINVNIAIQATKYKTDGMKQG